MQYSIVDQISKKRASTLRRLQDRNVKFLGTYCQILRIDKGDEDAMGGYEEEVRTTLIENAIINHPWGGAVQLFSDYDASTMQLNTTALDLYEFLPITLKIPYNGDATEVPVSLNRGDLIVEVIQDEHENKIPLILEVEKLIGNITNKYIAGKHYELSLYRGELPALIKDYVTKFINGELT